MTYVRCYLSGDGSIQQTINQQRNKYINFHKMILVIHIFSNIAQFDQQLQLLTSDLATIKSIMNLNIYKRHKSFFLQAQNKEKLPSKAYSNALAEHRSNELLLAAKKIYHSQSNLLDAIELLEKILDMQPNHDEALYICGVCQVQIERYESAIWKFEKITQNYSLKQNALLLASISCNKLGLTSKSYYFVNQCIKKSPRYQEALCFRGKLHLQMNNFIRSELDFRNVVSINSQSYLGFIGLGDCSKFTNHYGRAIELYQKSIQLLSISSDQQKINLKEIHFKIGICYYLLQKYQQCHYILANLSLSKEMMTSELFYYLGLSQIQLNDRQKGLNHLQYAIRLESNPLIIQKAYKKLILLYLENYQFYEAHSISKLCDIYTMKVKWWKQLIDAFMLVIRNQYEDGLAGIARIYDLIKSDKHTISELRIADKDKKIDDFIFKTQHTSSLFKRKNSILKSEKRVKNHKKAFDKPQSLEKKYPLIRVNRSNDKISSLRINTNKSQSFPLKLGRFKTEYQQPDYQQSSTPPFTEKQKQIILPFLLRFKAYCEFFLDKWIPCSQTLEQYQLYIQDLLGKESDVKFSKALCQILMLVQSEELQEGLLKCNQAINIHFQRYSFDNIVPLLYKVAILIKMAIVSILNDHEQKSESYQILILTLQMIAEKDVLKDHSLTHYFCGIIYILIDDYRQSQKQLQSAVKLADLCGSNMLFIKGMIEIKLGNYLMAFKELSSSLLIKKSDRAYLARSIILCCLSEDNQLLKQEVISLVVKSFESSHFQANDNLIMIRQCIVEKCLDDLQNYIDLCEKDDQITIWVTKILFACRSYDQVVVAIQKITIESQEMNKISQCLSIYNGDFERGGQPGLTIKASLDGMLFSQQQTENILKDTIVKNYNLGEFGYLEANYQKWLILLQLYMKEQYELWVKYAQKLIFQSKQQQEQLLLRYNMAFIYFLIDDYDKGLHIIKSLSKFHSKYDLRLIIERIVNGNYDNDECLSDLTSFLHMRTSKILSNYLPFKSISLLKGNAKVKVYGRINIPFPNFPKPNINLEFDINFILSQLDLNKIPKSLQAPWIKRSNQSIQFTDHMQDTITSFESKVKEESSLHIPLKELSASRHQ